MAEGADAGGVVAFVRGDDVVTLVPRLTLRRSWGDTRLPLPGGRWCDRLAGEGFEGSVPIRTLLAQFPVALLARE
jgi:(1->4)-alpha-D-glucan 1-alpha-D-glucosylmutase